MASSKRPKLTKDELQGLIAAQAGNALGGLNGELATDRDEALKRYKGDAYGDEVVGRSGVISRDVADAIDFILPSLIRIFMSTSDVVRFNPTSQGDMGQADLETVYVNNVITKENNGFLILHDWFKDALLLRNGYVKYDIVETDKVETENYDGLTQIELQQLLDTLGKWGDDYEIVGQSEEKGTEDEGPVFSIQIKRKRKESGIIEIMPVPPEELLISSRCRGQIQDAPFVQHAPSQGKTRSELIEMGLSQDFVYGLSAMPGTTTSAGADQKTDRSTVSDERNENSDVTDPSMEQIEYKESYLYVDWDNDGVAELRKVVEVGGEIPDGDDWNHEINYMPFCSLVPKRMPHRHVGISLQDDLQDLARIKTQLMRLLMDNSYLLTNIEWLVNERVHLADFMTTRPGGIKRVRDKMPVDGSARQVERQSILQHVLPVLDYIDQAKIQRAGIDKNLTGLDADTLKWATADAAKQALSQANLKIEMIARMFAETGVRDLAIGIRKLCLQYRKHARYELIRGDWQNVNPSNWVVDRQVNVNVGIGTGSTEEVRSNLLLMGQIQEKAAQAGIVSPKNAYNLAERMSDNLGFKDRGTFFTDPDSPEGQQLAQQQAAAAQHNPLADVAQIQGQWKQIIEQIKNEGTQTVAQMKEEMDLLKFRVSEALKIAQTEVQALSLGKVTPDEIDIGEKGIGTEVKPLMDELGSGQTERIAQLEAQVQTLVQAMQQLQLPQQQGG